MATYNHRDMTITFELPMILGIAYQQNERPTFKKNKPSRHYGSRHVIVFIQALSDNLLQFANNQANLGIGIV